MDDWKTPLKPLNKRVVCKDGFTVSVQASRTHYSTPRNDRGPYTHVECGFPTARVEQWADYAEDPDDHEGTVFGYLPANLLLLVIEEHGGVKSGNLPELDLAHEVTNA